MKYLKFVFYRSNILFLLSVSAGIALPQASAISIFLILPALMTIMTITPLRIPRGFFRRIRPLITPAIQGNLMNYIILGNLIIFASLFFIREEGFWFGMVLVAAAPPAVSMLSLSKSFRADLTVSFAGFAGAYLGALLIIPLIGLGFLKYNHLNYLLIILVVGALIPLPLVLSRIIVEKEWDGIIQPHEGIIIDYCFFIVFYTIAARTRELILHWSSDMSVILTIAALTAFIIFFAVRKIGRLSNVAENKIISLLLLVTMKNYGLAGGLALLLFSEEVAFAALAFTTVNFLFTNWLKYTKIVVGRSIVAEETPPS